MNRREERFWNLSIEDAATCVGSGPSGLRAAQAAAALRRCGPNRIDASSFRGPMGLLLRQVQSPLVLLLVFAALLSVGLGEWTDAAIILGIILTSSLLGFLQEHRAEGAVKELARRLTLLARVLRDGRPCEVPFEEVVPGDVALLSAGALVPGDGLVLEATDFLVNEAAMTGESLPVEKRPGIVAAQAPLQQRWNTVFLGSSVRSGTARVLVMRTGSSTEYGAIAGTIRRRPAETDFARGLRGFGELLLRVMTGVVLGVLTASVLLGKPVVEALMFSVAIAIGLSPEMLPAIVSVTLSAGARKLARGGVLVRRLEAIEDLGSMDVLCTDKTGTLTKGTLDLRDAVDPSGNAASRTLHLAWCNASLETGIENPLDAAIAAAGSAAGFGRERLAKLGEIPYDFQRRRLTVVVGDPVEPDRATMITKGAFAEVLAVCDRVRREGGQAPATGREASWVEPEAEALLPRKREELEEWFRARGEEGLRVLAVASRSVRAASRWSRQDEGSMVLEGFLLFEDPPKESTAAAIRDLASLGVAIKVISGDNRHVSAHLASIAGLDPKAMLTGAELATMKDEALWHLAPRTDLFVEVDPQQKERIVRALQRTGSCVGYLGDGINDVPALHAADVGISVEGAVDVARESADLVMLQRDLEILREGVVQGRRTFANTLKYVSITTSANFGNMVSMALAAPFLPFFPMAAKQILLNNFLSDLPAVAVSGDNVDPEEVTGPPHWSIPGIRRFMFRFGLLSSVFDLATFALLLLVFRVDEQAFQSAWFFVSLASELAVLLVLRTRRPVFGSRPGGLLLATTATVFATALALPFLPLAEAFGIVPLDPLLFATMALVVAAGALATEAAKLRTHELPARPLRSGA